MRITRGWFPALAFALTATAAWPQVPVGSEFLVNAYTTGPQYFSRPAFIGGGSFVVVWESLGQDGSGPGIFGRRFDAQGAPLGADFQVNTYTTGNQRRPAVAGSASGFVVVWQSDGQDGSSYGVHAQRYDGVGTPAGAEFRVNQWTTGAQSQPAVAMAGDGRFVVAWNDEAQDGSDFGILGRRFAADGTPAAGEFVLNAYTTSEQVRPAVAVLADGGFVSVWQSNGQDGSGWGIFGRRFDAAGNAAGVEFRVNTTGASQQTAPAVAAGGPRFVVVWNGEDADQYGVFGQRYSPDATPRGTEFQVNSFTTGVQYGFASFVAVDGAGNFGVAWSSNPGGNNDVKARFFDSEGGPRSAEVRANTYTPGGQGIPSIAADAGGRFVISWSSPQDGNGYGVFAQRFATVLAPAALAVDAAASGSSDGNNVLEACETVSVAPAWKNVGAQAVAANGAASAFVGPAGAAYSIADGTAAYGTITPGGTASCTDCYAMAVSCATPRPVQHWDTSFIEQLSPLPAAQRWTLHVGESFTDVPPSSPFYRFVETILHKAVTGGCAATTYCPTSTATREQMAPFVLVSKEGAGYNPPPCGVPVFGDVPASSPFCKFIEELARRGVVSGCGGGNYCPIASVTREQMAVFVLRTLDPALNPPACVAGSEMFGDVPSTSGFCKWIEELARRGIVTGCGGGNYCPAAPVTREQMSVFLAGTFGLKLYGL